VLDRSERQRDECEGCPRGVEPVSAVDDEADAPVEPLVLSVVDLEPDRGQDSRSSLADRLRDGDERLQPAARCLGAESVEQDGDLIF